MRWWHWLLIFGVPVVVFIVWALVRLDWLLGQWDDHLERW